MPKTIQQSIKTYLFIEIYININKVDDSESNSSDFSDVHRESEIDIEPNKTENLKQQANEETMDNEKPDDNAPKSRKKVHLNEEVSPLQWQILGRFVVFINLYHFFVCFN